MAQRYKPKKPDKDKALVAAMKRLAKKYPRYGYRFITPPSICRRVKRAGELTKREFNDYGERESARGGLDAKERNHRAVRKTPVL